MKDIVTKNSFYAAWEYEKEELALNEASEKGLQLIKGGCFHSKFRMDKRVLYIYQLDYNTKIGDPVRYREVFEEQGWEYINSTFNGWHYFRKLYKDGMDESETHIYTDMQSLQEMQNRWLMLITVLDIISIVFCASYLYLGISRNMISTIAEGAVFSIMVLTISLAIINAKRKRSGKKGVFTIPLQVVLPLLLVAFGVIFILLIAGPI